MLKDELHKAIIECDCKFPIQWVDTEELHLEPKALKENLQEKINEFDNVDRVC